MDSAARAADSSPWAISDGRSPLPMAVPAPSPPQPAVISSPEPSPATVPAPRSAPKLDSGTTLQLIWFDPESLPRLRRKAAFRPILAALEDQPLDAELDDPAHAKDPMTIEDRREIFEILTRADAADDAGLGEALETAVRDDGKFISPFMLFAGDLQLPFDELARLRATVTAASPFAAGDEPLKAAIADAREFLKASDLLSPSGVTEGFTTRITEAFRKIKRAVSADYLEEQTERALLEGRHYQRREVLGGTHLRGMLQMGNAGSKPVPTYLPEALAKKLPMFSRFRVRLIAEVGLQEDQYETHPAALRVAALARVTAAPKRGGGRS